MVTFPQVGLRGCFMSVYQGKCDISTLSFVLNESDDCIFFNEL